jgi:hypothetical protein
VHVHQLATVSRQAIIDDDIHPVSILPESKIRKPQT